MYHSITFGDKNTWEDWHLVPTSRPLFNPPTVKKKTLDIPGGDGVLDLTESLTGYPVYNNREGSIEFLVLNSYCHLINSDEEWQDTYSKIMDYLHGRYMSAMLEDDEDYYYEGRFTVDSWKSEKNNSKIVIGYSVKPYKMFRYTSLGIGSPLKKYFDRIPVNHIITGYTFDTNLIGRMPVRPIFKVTTSKKLGIMVRFVNQTRGVDITKTLVDGSVQIPEFAFLGEKVTLYLVCVIPDSIFTNLMDSSGANLLDSNGNGLMGQAYSTVSGVLSIDFRPGRL